MGHLDAAAGVAGLIKTVLMLKNRQFVPSINYNTPNPSIDFKNGPFYVCNKLAPWASNGTPRRAGVSSFGIGGTNAHAILEEAPVLAASGKSRSVQLITLSAKTVEALDQATDNLIEFFQRNPRSNLADVAFTLNIGRREYSHRRVFLLQDGDNPKKFLNKEDKFFNTLGNQNRSIVFVFSGDVEKKVHLNYEQENVFPGTNRPLF